MNKLSFAKNNKASALLAILTLVLVALGCGAEKPSAPPTESEAQALVKGTMSDFADAINKGDFTSFKANASKEFQSQFPDDKIKASFKDFIDQKDAVSPILKDAASKTVKFSTPPAVSEVNGYSVLKTTGTIDSEPQPVKVDNEYVYQDGKWKLLKVGVDLQ